MAEKNSRRNETTDALFDAILSLESREECYAFFEDLCTVKEISYMAQRLQAAALVNAGGIDLHARALTRDDPCGRTLHTREKLGALGRVRKVKVELLDRIRCSEEAALHLLGSRAIGLEIVHIGIHTEMLRIVEQLRAIERLSVGKDDRKAVKPDKRTHNARRRIGSDVL